MTTSSEGCLTFVSSVFRTGRPSDSGICRTTASDTKEQKDMEPVDDLVLPNRYYKRSKHSKVGFKDGLRPIVETQEERLARTFNILAPFPKEAIMNIPGRNGPIDPELLTDVDKRIKAKKAEERRANAVANVKSVEKKNEPVKRTVNTVPRNKNSSQCPNAILIDKSILFSTPLDEYIVVGKVLRPHGLNGHVKVLSLCHNPDVRLCEPGYRFLKFPNRDETVMPIQIQYGRLFDGVRIYRLKLEGVDTKDQAMRLNGAYIAVSMRDVPALEEDCYYSRDLLTLDVYLFNDDTKTKLGKVIGFRHREDLVSIPKLASLTEDLIEVEMDIKLSLKTLRNLTQTVREKSEQEPVSPLLPKPKSISVVTERDLETADEVIDAEEELVNSNMTGVHYVKYYVCSICKREYTNYDRALQHEREHEAGVVPEFTEPDDTSHSHDEKGDQTIYSLDEYYEKGIKRPIRRFFIPLIKDETIKFVDIPNKSIYVEAYTIFIGEDGNTTKAPATHPK